ncbi:MAG: DUF5074 domain-containing protein [Muribaculaceae bacterium]|nr:DUF5074 domain-containing protein [Muribaculaceae bacterium]
MKKLFLMLGASVLSLSGMAAGTPDLSKVRFTVGEGDNTYLLVMRYDVPARMDNFVYAIKSDNENLTAIEALTMLKEADDRMVVDINGDEAVISVDLNGDSKTVFDDTDIKDVRVVAVSGNTLASDGTTKVLTLSEDGEDASHADYFFYIPQPGEEGVWIPDEMTVKLSDAGTVLPCFAQVPDGQLNSNTNWQASSSNESYRLDRSKIITPYTLVEGTFNAMPTFVGATGTTYVRYRPQKVGEYTYYESNWMTFNIESPEKPITAITMKESNVTSGLNKEVQFEFTYEPEDATYTAVGATVKDAALASYTTSAGLKTKTKEGETKVTVYCLNDETVSADFTLTCKLENPVTDVNFGPGTENGVINVYVKQLIGLRPVVSPDNADIKDVTITLSDNGTTRDDFTCSTYRVNWWDNDGTRVQFYELSGHRPTGDKPAKVKVTSADGSFEKEFVVNVLESDRTPIEGGYTEGTIILNEEWFGHTNGGLNYVTPDNEVIYQAYERENPGESFGCTSQYGTIWNDKLIVISKQPDDGGDVLRGGGCVVIADAKTMKKIGGYYNRPTYDGQMGDGRAVAGATEDKIYVTTSNGIYVMDISDVENPEVTGHLAGSGGTDLYSGQVGDIINGGRYVYAVMQSTGILCIDPLTDKIVKTFDDANAQGVTQTADGTVWYATITDGHSVFVGIDPETLEETDRIDMPAEIGTVACGWGAWRSTAFKGDHSTGNLWFTTGAGSIVGGGTYYYRFNPKTDDPATIEPFFSLAGLKGVNGFGEEVEQMNYGTSVFDPRNNRLIVMTGRKGAASGQYRDHWLHFVDGTSAEITRTFKLTPYYWFQSLPILPDKYDAVIDINEEMTVPFGGGDKVIDLAEVVKDPDGIDSNIRISLLDAPALLADSDEDSELDKVAEVTLEDKTLTISPKKVGVHTFTLAAQSNGRTVSKTINVKVDDVQTGIDEVSGNAGLIKCDGRRVYLTGFAGHNIRIYNVAGEQVNTFDVDCDDYVFDFGGHSGVYILHSDNNHSAKVIIR